jgi:hypothetical protein
MRLLATLSLVVVLCRVQAQRPGIATLLSLADCLDTTCVSTHLRPIDYCLMGGKEKDGWMWFKCGANASWVDHERNLTVSFFGYANSNYRDYLVITGDTSIADALTAELHHLGFTLDRPLLSKGFIYGNAAYPKLEVHRLEVRTGTIHYKRSGDRTDPRALPKDTLRCDHESFQKMAQEVGYDNFEVIPELRWVFKVRVPTPNLDILLGEKDGVVKLRYLGGEPMAEFTIRDPMGKEVFRSSTQDWLTELDLSELSNGVYYLTILSKWGMFSKPFLKN